VNGVKVFTKENQSKSTGLLSQARLALASLLGQSDEQTPRRGRLLLEQLEGRQMMAADTDMLYTDGVSMASTASTTSASFANTSSAEGEAAPDLVAFAKALAAGGVKFYGAAWCPFCTEQKQLFQDGGKFLPFIEVTKADRSLNAVGTAAGIQTYPTWEFPDDTRATGVLTLEQISQRSGIAIPSSDNPSFAAIGSQTVAIGSPLHIPIDAYDPGGGPVTITVSVADPTLIQANVLQNNRSVRIDMDGYGDMVFELFEDKAPRPTGRIIELANANFYDGILFHRVIDNFVLQAGDPTATGTGGSTLPDFDDQFHPDLQHNRSGVLSYAKSSDDTNDSQFFITEGPTRTLDFNHSIFGQLVEGDDVREAISELGDAADKGTNSSDKPLRDVKITSMDVFNDTENSVVMLKAIGNRTGTTNVTFTATDASGRTFTEVVAVTVVADSGTGSNSQPYLNDIPAPAAAPNTAPVTLQLSSVDVEGDAVTYTATSATTGVTAAVNASTGLVTVTPSAGFTGTATVNVGVAPASGVAGALSGQNDTQRVTFNFTGNSTTLSAPTAVDLVTASDSGASSTDNITSTSSLTFTVSGVQSGNEVRLFSGTTEVGRGTATGTTINITTNNIAALGDGTYSITARQFSGANSSTASPALSITYDATQPVRITGFPTNANLNTPVNVNLTHAEEGSGLVYAFTTAPAGATINPTTGVISWTPTSAQQGSQSFTLTLTDTAGNVRTETFPVTVAGAALAGTRLEVATLAGAVVTSVAAGDEFLLRLYARDLRGALDQSGVFSAFTDVLFNSALVSPVTTTPITYGSGFSTNPDGTFSTGLIDELGAIANSLAATNLAEVLVATVRMKANSSGTVTFRTESADLSGNEFLLFEEDDPIPSSLIQFGSTDLTIGGRFTAVNDSVTVTQGAAATTINVLQNDTFSSGVTGTLTITSVGTPSNGGTATIVNGSVRYQPAASFAGTETFTYVATDNTGVTQTATVTATVTGTNNPPPTAVADSFTVAEDAVEASFNVRSNDSTSDAGETISVSAVGTSTRGSTIRLGTDGATILYKPAANFNGTETVTYTLLDSRGASATGTVTFTVTAVNDAPPAAAIARTVFRSSTATVVGDLTAYGTNVDGASEALTVALVGSASGGGSFTVSGTTISYTPPSATFTGTDVISYRTTDAGGLTSTGTITLTVSSATPTNFSLVLNDSGGLATLGSALAANLTGTTTSGQPVTRSVALSTASNSLQFSNLEPGNYQVEVPAVPFLVGMASPQRVAFTATETGGNMSGNVNVGSLNPAFISIRDFFSNAPRQTIFAAVAPGSDSLIVLGARSATNVVAPIVNLNANANSVTIRGNNAAGAATQATVPAVNDRRVETRATQNGIRLLKISLAPTDVTFAAPTTAAAATTQSTVSGEGESNASSRALVLPNGSSSDVFFANATEGDGEELTEDTLSAQSDATPDVENEDDDASVDQAFADVAESLSLVSGTGDALAEDESTAPAPEAVDELLSSSGL
jgi:large repetitive protein